MFPILKLYFKILYYCSPNQAQIDTGKTYNTNEELSLRNSKYVVVRIFYMAVCTRDKNVIIIFSPCSGYKVSHAYVVTLKRILHCN